MPDDLIERLDAIAHALNEAAGRIEQAEADRDRYRKALERIAEPPDPFPSARVIARAALDHKGEPE